jgi:aminoglycoside phosphotransferase (APT) family kinase protein
VQSAALLRRLHDASVSFVAPSSAIWRQHECAAVGADEIVCHGDIGPHNTVYRDGTPVAFIDFDSIRPNHPLIEFGNAAWRFVPLGDDAYFEMSDFPSTPDLPARLSLFARTYGVNDPDHLFWALHQAKQRTVEAARYWPISPGEGAAVLRQVADDLQWLDQNADRLVEGRHPGRRSPPTRSRSLLTHLEPHHARPVRDGSRGDVAD